mgnify:CR=1 FL=1
MLFIFENIFLLVSLLFAILVLTIFLSINFKKYRIVETDKLLFLNNQIESEKIVSQNLKSSTLEIDLLSQKTQLKLQKIKVDVLETNYSLSEIF